MFIESKSCKANLIFFKKNMDQTVGEMLSCNILILGNLILILCVSVQFSGQGREM